MIQIEIHLQREAPPPDLEGNKLKCSQPDIFDS